MSTYAQLYVHVVFAVKHRNALIDPAWEERLYQYITGIVQRKEQKMLAINGTPDNLHFFIGMKPSCTLSDLVREVKKASHEMIATQQLSSSKFAWQEGFGAFSYSHSQIDGVVRYILRQKEHHKKRSFREEYLDLLAKFQVQYQEQYVFDWL